MLDKLKDELAKDIFSISKSEAISKGICVDCKQPAVKNCYSQAGLKEYRITGLCEKCFDKIFEED